jgi:hypothetical protein
MSCQILVMTDVGYPGVSSAFAGRVSPTTAKLRVERGPPVELVDVDDVLVVLVLVVLVLVVLVPPEHDPPHADMASLTHCESHLLLQQ